MNHRLLFLVNKKTKEALQFGPVPPTWGNITGLADISDEAAADLSWAKYPDYGFVTQEAALGLGIDQNTLDDCSRACTLIQADLVRVERDKLLSDTDWVVARSTELGEPIPINYTVYRNALRDLPSMTGFPWSFTMPILEP